MGGVTGCDGLGREVCVSGGGGGERVVNDQSGLRILMEENKNKILIN